MPLPPLPDARRLADACRRTAALQRVEAATVEKDFYLTRLIWALAENQGDRLLLKGGTCLSKVDLGYHRMSEDADFVVPPRRRHPVQDGQHRPHQSRPRGAAPRGTGGGPGLQ